MKTYISEIILNNFRNYSNKNFEFSNDFNIIIGENGVGKTNILEAISIFGDLKGFRKSETIELISLNDYKNEFLPKNVLYSLFIKIKNSDYETITIICTKDNNDKYVKTVRINNQILRKHSLLNNILKINYLIPQMDTFFIDASSIRRKFLDTTGSLLYINHYEMVKKYEFFVKERMKILMSENKDIKWLEIIEKKIVETGVAIASVRNEIIDNLNNIYNNYELTFPVGLIKIKGTIENMLLNNKAIDVEKYYLTTLKNNRLLDLKARKTTFGIHKSDLEIIHKEKNIPAGLCSTGEQKLLLISLIIIRCIFCKNINKGLVILLLDEICSHLDKKTKNLLFFELNKLNIQVFITGLNQDDFEILNGNIINL